ncbi:thiol-disulfide oxidoreductase DCC family protein [Chryseomicrobium palamuruense]|uniref:Thiol-disulfide oxidoreductase DCC family protein n=1 Tax=Chryseomicrobium palamuruense TaxID=682973 RepID=A0ABV8UX22_9BACL
MEPSLVLYDGLCNFCDASVKFIWKHNTAGTIHFTSLQGETGQQLLRQHQIPSDIDSFIFIENGKAYLESDAAFQVARHLDGPWKMLSVGRILPKSLRNAGYHVIARNRYKWFGQKDACEIPPPEVRARFID